MKRGNTYVTPKAVVGSCEKGVQENGMVGLIFHTIGVSDGMTNGNNGMSYSLPSRDLITEFNRKRSRCPMVRQCNRSSRL